MCNETILKPCFNTQFTVVVAAFSLSLSPSHTLSFFCPFPFQPLYELVYYFVCLILLPVFPHICCCCFFLLFSIFIGRFLCSSPRFCSVLRKCAFFFCSRLCCLAVNYHRISVDLIIWEIVNP